MKKLKKILIGIHNKGKIKEISYLLNKKIEKISPFQLKIKSPAETGKSFKSNSELKAKYFSYYRRIKVSSSKVSNKSFVSVIQVVIDFISF